MTPRLKARVATLPGALFVLWLAAAAGCVTDDGAPAWPAGDPATFEVLVQPTLAVRCANPSCHGRAGGFEVYAERLHRADPGTLWRDGALTATERRHNQREVEARIRTDRPDDSPILRMCLPGEDGHRGFAPLQAASDPEYAMLRSWVRAAGRAP